MRMAKGKPFMDVREEAPPPDVDEIKADGDRRRAEKLPAAPVFSEAFLYPRIGKGDARFVLGVAEEYEHVIAALGPEAVRAILDVTPRLANRLGTGAKVVEWLADARDESRMARFEQEYPSQVILDSDAMEATWQVLHDEYQTNFEPEKTMDPGSLRAYHALTDALGPHEQAQRQKEIDRLPEKIERRDKQVAERTVKRERNKAAREARESLRDAAAKALAGTDAIVSTELAAALAAYDEAFERKDGVLASGI